MCIKCLFVHAFFFMFSYFMTPVASCINKYSAILIYSGATRIQVTVSVMNLLLINTDAESGFRVQHGSMEEAVKID